MKKVKGKIQAVSMNKKGVKVNEQWYNFTDKLKSFFENSKGKIVELSLDDNNNVVYVKFIREQQQGQPIFQQNQVNAILQELEEININIISLNTKIQNLIDLLYKIHTGKEVDDFVEGGAK